MTRSLIVAASCCLAAGCGFFGDPPPTIGQVDLEVGRRCVYLVDDQVESRESDGEDSCGGGGLVDWGGDLPEPASGDAATVLGRTRVGSSEIHVVLAVKLDEADLAINGQNMTEPLSYNGSTYATGVIDRSDCDDTCEFTVEVEASSQTLVGTLTFASTDVGVVVQDIPLTENR